MSSLPLLCAEFLSSCLVELSCFEIQSDSTSAVATDGILVSLVGKIISLTGTVISVLYGKLVIDDGEVFSYANALMSFPSFKMETAEGIPVPCDDFKTLCRLAKRLIANLSFRIAETFLILLSVAHFMDFWTFFDASKPLPSSEPIRSTSDETASVIVDTWMGNLCCRVRSGISACIAEPVTS